MRVAQEARLEREINEAYFGLAAITDQTTYLATKQGNIDNPGKRMSMREFFTTIGDDTPVYALYSGTDPHSVESDLLELVMHESDQRDIYYCIDEAGTLTRVNLQVEPKRVVAYMSTLGTEILDIINERAEPLPNITTLGDLYR